jgi:hypothetical protein
MNVIDTVELDERPGYRALLVADENPNQPEDDGAAPIVWLEYRHGWRAETVDLTFSSNVYSKSSEVERAAEFFGSKFDHFARYLRLFHGCTGVDQYDGQSATYFAYDPAEVRERWGLTDEYLAEHPDVVPCSMGEYRAYLDGECYGIVVEKLVLWIRAGAEGRLEWHEEEGNYRTVYRDEDLRIEWEEADSCWGFYGDLSGYVTQRAQEMILEAE